MKRWPLRTRLAIWCALLLTLIVIVFSLGSGWNIYRDQVEAFQDIRNYPTSSKVVSHETSELVSDLAVAYAGALPLVFLVATIGVWWITRKALNPLKEVAEAAEQLHAKSLNQRLREAVPDDEVGRLVHVLNQLFDRLERSFMQATRFTSDAAHELKTPLTIMRGEIETALRTNPNEQAGELLESLLQQTQRLGSIAEKLLLLSQADSGTLTLIRTEVDLTALCDDLVDDAEILALSKELQIKKSIAANVRVSADESLLRQVLLNLLDNAIKYNLQGGDIKISLEKAGSVTIFRISNSGSKIPAEDQARVFERFYRIDASRSSETRGTGLGLSLCREIILAHRGQIWVEHGDPTRTTFAFSLSRIG